MGHDRPSGDAAMTDGAHTDPHRWSGGDPAISKPYTHHRGAAGGSASSSGGGGILGYLRSELDSFVKGLSGRHDVSVFAGSREEGLTDLFTRRRTSP